MQLKCLSKSVFVFAVNMLIISKLYMCVFRKRFYNCVLNSTVYMWSVYKT